MPSQPGNINHFGGVRLRVTGEGELNQTLWSLQQDTLFPLVPHTMVSVTSRELVTLSNFINQRAQLELRTGVINEWFVISKIVILVKPTFTGYPQ